MHTINIRFASTNDIDNLVDMQIAFEEYFQKKGIEVYKISEEDRKKDIIELNFSENSLLRTLVAEINGELAGRISFYRGYTADTPPYYNFHLSGIFVKPEFRGMNVAEKLFVSLVEIAKEEKIEVIKWNVWEHNDYAIKFYKKIGGKYYSEVGEHQMFLEVV